MLGLWDCPRPYSNHRKEGENGSWGSRPTRGDCLLFATFHENPVFWEGLGVLAPMLGMSGRVPFVVPITPDTNTTPRSNLIAFPRIFKAELHSRIYDYSNRPTKRPFCSRVAIHSPDCEKHQKLMGAILCRLPCPAGPRTGIQTGAAQGRSAMLGLKGLQGVGLQGYCSVLE